MHKRWILVAFLIVTLASTVWRFSCFLAFEFWGEELPPVAFTLCMKTPKEAFVFCPNFVTTTSSTYDYPVDTLPPNDFSTLIDLKDFKFHSCPICGPNRSQIVAVVHSAVDNEEKRQAIRSTWGTWIKTFFMLGETYSAQLAQKLDREMVANGDIVQGSFNDSYHNMTYKHAMTLKWVTYFCRNATYILKADDDLFVHVANLYKFIRQNLTSHGVRRLILCRSSREPRVERSYRSKWRVTFREYQGDHFPSHCTGGAILYSPDVIFELYSKTQQLPYFWIDDAHITGTAASQVNITMTDIGTEIYRYVQECKDMIRKQMLQEGLLFCLTDYPFRVEGLWKLYTSDQPTYVIG